MSMSKHVVNATCAMISHPWSKNCLEAYRMMLYSSIIGSAKLMMPFITTRALIMCWKKKKLTNEIIKEFFTDLSQYLVMSSLLCTMFVVFECLFRYLLGRFTISTLVFFPGLFSGMSFIILNKKLAFNVYTAYVNTALESVAILMSHFGLIKLNPYTETAFFMLVNACMMYVSCISSKSDHFDYTWFFKPDNESLSIDDEKAFMKILLKKTRNYFGLGFGFGILRTLMKDFSVLTPKNIHNLISLRSLKPGFFTGSYIAIYELTIFALKKYFKKDNPVYAIPAGFLSGLSYIIDPNLPVNLTLFINLIQFLYKLLDIRWLRRVSMGLIFFCLSNGTLLHIQTLYPKSMSKVGMKFIKMTSNSRSEAITEAFKRINLL